MSHDDTTDGPEASSPESHGDDDVNGMTCLVIVVLVIVIVTILIDVLVLD